MTTKKRIAFIKAGEFSHINNSVRDILSREFPDHQLDIIDCSDLITKRDPLALLQAFRYYWKVIFSRKRTLADTFIRTPYYFNKVRSGLRKRLAGQDYLFTFQTQSLFDLSLEKVPHFVYTDHTHLANKAYPGFDMGLLFADAWIECEKQIYRNAAKVFTMSSNITASVIKDYGCDPQKVNCVYCGANVNAGMDEQFDPARYSSKNILFTGVEWERKGGPELAEAFREVLRVHPDARLTVVGCSPKLDLPNCTTTGRIPLDEVKRYFMEATVFCLPTRIEPFGVVFLEAMAHQLPVVATRIGAIPDFIREEKNGYLVTSGDPKALAEKLILLLNDPARCAAFGEEGHRLFWEKYTWQATGKRIHEEITALVE